MPRPAISATKESTSAREDGHAIALGWSPCRSPVAARTGASGKCLAERAVSGSLDQEHPAHVQRRQSDRQLRGPARKIGQAVSRQVRPGQIETGLQKLCRTERRIARHYFEAA